MIKKAALFFVFVAFLITVYGCETAKGAFRGAKKDFQTLREGSMNGWQRVHKIDDWIRTNLW